MSGFCQPANRIYIALVTCNFYCCGSGIFFYHVCLLPYFLLLDEITIPFGVWGFFLFFLLLLLSNRIFSLLQGLQVCLCRVPGRIVKEFKNDTEGC